MFNPNNPFKKNAVADAASGVLKSSIEEKTKYAEMTDQQLLESDHRLAQDEIMERKRNGRWTIQESSQLAELSRFTLSRYAKKAKDDVDYRYNDTRPERAHRPDSIKKAEKKIRNKRTFGDSRPSKKSLALGEEEQIDELSRDTHARYRKAAKKNMRDNYRASDKNFEKSQDADLAGRHKAAGHLSDVSNRQMEKGDKRQMGLRRSERLAPKKVNEENLDEGIKSKLTPDEAHAVLKKHGSGKDTNFFSLSSSQVSGLVDHAKSIGYRKGRNAPGSTGRMYHDALQRHAAKSKMNEEQIDEISVDKARAAIRKASNETEFGGKKVKDRSKLINLAGQKVYSIPKKAKVMATEGAMKRGDDMETYKKKPADYKPTKMGASYDAKRDKTKGAVDLNREDEVVVNGKTTSKRSKEKVAESYIVERALDEYRGRMKVLHEMRMSDDARELQLYIENDGQLYRQQTTSIMKNLQKKFEKGAYDSALARKLWRYLVDNGAKKYVQEYGNKGDKAANMFPGKVRDEVAAAMEADWKAELEAGNKI